VAALKYAEEAHQYENAQWLTVYGCPLGKTTNEDNQMIQSLISHLKQTEDKSNHSLEISSTIRSLSTYKHLLVPSDGVFECAKSPTTQALVLFDPKNPPAKQEEEKEEDEEVLVE